MSQKTQSILIAYGNAIVSMLKAKVQPLSATGKTVNSIHDIVKPNRLTVYGRGYFDSIETGRGPRKSSTYGHFDQNLEPYLIARGFPQKTSKSGVKYFKIGNSWSSAKSLAHKINKEGDATYRKGGRKIYSDELAVLVESMNKDIVKQTKKDFITSLQNSFKNGLVSS